MIDSRARPELVNSRSGYGNPRRRPDGFTLLEVMAAVVIIAIVMTAVFRLQGQTISMAEATRFQATAMLLAQKKMSEVRGPDAWFESAGSGNFGNDFPGFSWRVSVDPMNTEALGETGKDLMRVDVSIFFNEDAREYRLRAYRFLQD